MIHLNEVMKMNTVIGLLPSNQEICEELKRIEEAGFTNENVRVITKEKSIKKILGCKPNRIVAKYASWGALLGIATYGIFILVAVWCDCSIYHISQLIAFEIILIGIIIGASVGGIIGVFSGMAEYEKDTHLYTQGIKFGNKVLLLQTESNNSEQAIEMLSQIGCLGVRILPELIEPI
jgi:hypothetical protein